MLHAELRGKLGRGRNELERLEDTLTSTIFGTLLLGNGGRRVLAEWLNSSRDVVTGNVRMLVDPEFPVKTETAGAWFWPHLDDAEPDVLLQFISTAIVIEAKYASAKSEVANAVEGKTTRAVSPDQLAREWRAIGPERADHYSQELRECLAGAERHLVYLVSSRHLSRAREELRSSYDILVSEGQSPSLLLLTWQDLHRILNELHERAKKREWWWSSLVQLLERRELQAFLGFAKLRGLREPGVLERWSAKWHHDLVAQRKSEFRRIDWPRLRFIGKRAEAWTHAFSRIPLGLFEDLHDIDWSSITRLAHAPIVEHNKQ